ncbi:MAG TPA: universal stress protein [Blastocatellia bacterium]|nr:universal stress protein [Blastocatellia bacterium]
MVASERITFERVLCPIDLLPDSKQALDYAASFARICGAKLLICHCRDQSERTRSAESGGLGEGGSAERSLVRLIEQAKFEHSVNGGDILIIDGDPLVAIPRIAADKRIDLIVMRSRRWQHARALLGSMAEAVCRTAPCPVLITHPRDREPTESMRDSPVKRVMIAYDFSSDAELALSYGLFLAKKHQAELHLLHILPSRARTEAPEVAMLALGAGTAFDEISNRLRSAVSGETRLTCQIKYAVREGQPYREVLAYAGEQEIDLICMGASGTGFGLHALFGSNADRVLRQAECPVIVARPLRPSMPVASPVG